MATLEFTNSHINVFNKKSKHAYVMVVLSPFRESRVTSILSYINSWKTEKRQVGIKWSGGHSGYGASVVSIDIFC